MTLVKITYLTLKFIQKQEQKNVNGRPMFIDVLINILYRQTCKFEEKNTLIERIPRSLEMIGDKVRVILNIFNSRLIYFVQLKLQYI